MGDTKERPARLFCEDNERMRDERMLAEIAKIRALIRDGRNEEASASDSTALRYFSDSDSTVSDDTDEGTVGVICQNAPESRFLRPDCVPRLRIPPPISHPLSQCIQAAQEVQQPKARGQSAFMEKEGKRAQGKRSSSLGVHPSNNSSRAPPRVRLARPPALLQSREASADRPLPPLPCLDDAERLTSRGKIVARPDGLPSHDVHLADTIAAIGRPLPPTGRTGAHVPG